MNVSAHQEKEKNEKKGKRKAVEERIQATDLKEAACCPFAVVQGAVRQKKLARGEFPEYLGPSKRPTTISTESKRVGNCSTTMMWLLIGAVQFFSLYILYCTYDKNFALHHSERLELMCFVDEQKVRIDN